ncbi:MAG: CAP domain-containing protein [Spirochaetaceae bacterium]|nr:CAP domain-containing protein [Spirochaetaceae bacterium]
MAHLSPRVTASTGAPSVAALIVAPVRQRAAALVTAFVLVLAALLTGAVTARPAGATNVEDTFTDRLNQARSSRGAPQLTTRAHLVAVAREQAVRMANRSTLYHNPNLTSDVNNWRWVGENVGYGPDAATVHVAFMNSPAHKANILDRDYTEVGIGAVVRDGRVWVAEVFRRPARITTSSVRTVSSVASRPDHALRLGSRGAAVTRVQARLGLSRTGYYGTYTKAAVSRFQQRQGWDGRGNCGRKTWARLF